MSGDTAVGEVAEEVVIFRDQPHFNVFKTPVFLRYCESVEIVILNNDQANDRNFFMVFIR